MFLSREQSARWAGNSPAAGGDVQHESQGASFLGKSQPAGEKSADLSVVLLTAFAERAAEHDSRRTDYVAVSSKVPASVLRMQSAGCQKKSGTQTAQAEAAFDGLATFGTFVLLNAVSAKKSSSLAL